MQLSVPVVTMWAFEGFLRAHESADAFQMRFPCEFLLAYITAIQYFCRHMDHLDMHFQNIRILQRSLKLQFVM